MTSCDERYRRRIDHLDPVGFSAGLVPPFICFMSGVVFPQSMGHKFSSFSQLLDLSLKLGNKQLVVYTRNDKHITSQLLLDPLELSACTV